MIYLPNRLIKALDDLLQDYTYYMKCLENGDINYIREYHTLYHDDVMRIAEIWNRTKGERK